MNEATAHNLRLYEVRSLSDMEKIRRPWNRLVHEMQISTPFQTWEWNFGIVKFEGQRVRLRIVVAENRDGEVVGIGPFWIRSKGLPGLTALEFIGTWRSDYLDLLFLEPYREALIHKLRSWMEQNDEWGLIDLQSLRLDTAKLICQDMSFQLSPFDVCSHANLPTTVEEYEQSFSKNRRKKIRRSIKGLGRDGALTFSISSTQSQLQSDLPYFYKLHQRRQVSKGERGRFFDRHWTKAFQEISLALSQTGLVRLGMLQINGEPAACEYTFRMRNSVFSYLIGMEPSLASHSPGNLLTYWMMVEAIKDGVRSYDLMRGNDPYKAWWTNETCQLFRVTRSRTWILHRLWEAHDSIRNKIYRSRLIKRIYHSTFGLYRKWQREEKHLS